MVRALLDAGVAVAARAACPRRLSRRCGRPSMKPAGPPVRMPPTWWAVVDGRCDGRPLSDAGPVAVPAVPPSHVGTTKSRHRELGLRTATASRAVSGRTTDDGRTRLMER
jgi:hypothetical protein